MIRTKRANRRQIVDLDGPEGNVFVLLGYARKWARELGIDYKIIESELEDAKENDVEGMSKYEHILSILDKHFGRYVIFEHSPRGGNEDDE